MTRPPWYVMLLASGVELRCRVRRRDMPDAPTACPVVDHAGVVDAIERRASAAVARAAAVPRADGAYRRSTGTPFRRGTNGCLLKIGPVGERRRDRKSGFWAPLRRPRPTPPGLVTPTGGPCPRQPVERNPRNSKCIASGTIHGPPHVD